jgi:DNA-binding IscR family transcriptional regulator
MQVSKIKEIAKQHGVKPGKLKKGDIIRLIQKAEGNFDCFATPADGYCDQNGCLWRSDCIKAA